MKIESSLLNSSDMHGVRDSIDEISAIDGEEKFRVSLIEYINDSSDSNDDMFFYEMLEFVRFLKPSSKHIAYTTRDFKISLNAPNDTIGKAIRKWEFVYDHECLHQLWETFKVEDRIMKEKGQCNHQLLNIASDCVINDYLRTIRRKDAPDVGIYPEVIKEKFGVEYDRKEDTQYSLYLKLLKAYEDNNMSPSDLPEDMDGEGGEGEEGDGDGNSSGNSGSGKGKGKGKGGGGNGGNDKGDSDGDGDGDDGEGGNGKGKNGKGKGNGDGDDGEGGKGKNGKGNSDGEGDEAGGKGIGKGHVEAELSDADLDRIKRAKEIIERYGAKISGALGQFVKKCKTSYNLTAEGLHVNVTKGGKGWNTQLTHLVDAYVKQRVFKFKRIFQKTYKRLKRGTGFVKPGEFIQPGKRVVDKTMTINVAFYIDRSGSMSNSLDNVFTAAYRIAESLKKQYRNDKAIDSVVFKMHTFDDRIDEIKFGQRASLGGGTCSFETIFKYILKHTNDYLINIIITDAAMNVSKDVVINTINNLNGIVIFVANSDNADIRDIAQKYPTQMKYILVKGDFEI